MKLISYTRLGQPGFGALTDAGLVDLTGRVAPQITSIKALLQADAVAAAAEIAATATTGLTLSDVTLLPVIPDPGKIQCVGVNYDEHRRETNRPENSYPTVFTRYPDSQVAHGQPMIVPAVSDRLDFEAEMAVIIGKPGRYIDAARAMDHIAGYACYNDGSMRDWQRHSHQYTPGKTFPGTGPFGPYMLTADEVDDYRSFPIQTRLNGEVMQDATLADLIFSVPELLAYISSYTPLLPGDVIITGTPGGVGVARDPQVFLQPGDVVEVDIGPLGTLRNTVIKEVTS